MEYTAFLDGSQADDKGRKIDQILQYGRFRLEFKHNYIQEVFPTDEQSKYSRIAPVSEDEIQSIRNHRAAQENIGKMYRKMLEFWKLDGERYQLWGLRPFRLWNFRNNHNHWRMTRVLKSLRLLGMEDAYRDFSMRLADIIKRKEEGCTAIRISERTMKIWKENLCDE